MSKPAISVIIPVYNAQDGIKRCVDSLLNQSFKNFEIILTKLYFNSYSFKIFKELSFEPSFRRIISKVLNDWFQRESTQRLIPSCAL